MVEIVVKENVSWQEKRRRLEVEQRIKMDEIASWFKIWKDKLPTGVKLTYKDEYETRGSMHEINGYVWDVRIKAYIVSRRSRWGRYDMTTLFSINITENITKTYSMDSEHRSVTSYVYDFSYLDFIKEWFHELADMFSYMSKFDFKIEKMVGH